MLQRRCYGHGKILPVLHTLRVAQASPGRWGAGCLILDAGVAARGALMLETGNLDA